jgi:uncharacterized protein (UPF0276 family)
MLEDGSADFCEILIDNFLHLEPKQVRDVIGNVPVGFHIMWSKFLEREPSELAAIGSYIRNWIDHIEPEYVSDHMAQFSLSGRVLPLLAELEYQDAFERACDRVTLWQQELGCQLLIENFPSTLDIDNRQIGFIGRLQAETGCGVLFDFSNAVIAEENCGVDATGWQSLAESTPHYHIAGFRKTTGEPSIAIDTHDVSIEDKSFDLLEKVLMARKKSQNEITVVVERDANIDVATWKEELDRARSLYGNVTNN